MHGHIQTMIIVVISFVVAVVMLAFGITMFSQNHQEQSAQQAVYTSLLKARDDNARAVSGVFALDKSEFEAEVQKANVQAWSNTNKGKIRLAYRYLPDNSARAQSLHLKEPIQAVKAVKVLVQQQDKNGNYQTINAINYVVSTRIIKADNDVSK